MRRLERRQQHGDDIAEHQHYEQDCDEPNDGGSFSSHADHSTRCRGNELESGNGDEREFSLGLASGQTRRTVGRLRCRCGQCRGHSVGDLRSHDEPQCSRGSLRGGRAAHPGRLCWRDCPDDGLSCNSRRYHHGDGQICPLSPTSLKGRTLLRAPAKLTAQFGPSIWTETSNRLSRLAIEIASLASCSDGRKKEHRHDREEQADEKSCLRIS